MSAGVALKELRQSLLYSEELGISLKKGTDSEYFKWFLASVLFGARISETIAKHTYKTFERYKLLHPRKILKAGWDFLINPIMREGGYVRYDGRKSNQILKNCEMLMTTYQGRLSNLHRLATDARDLKRRLQDFYGIGPTTANIFLRELRPFWKKADTVPLPAIKKLAQKYQVDLNHYDRKTLAFARIEAGLFRLRKH